MSTNQLRSLLETAIEEPDELTLFSEALLEGEYRDVSEAIGTWRYRCVKRMLDFCAAACLLLLFAVPGVFIAAMIVLTSPGPVFYREVRIGRFGRPFRIWKFRSMSREAAKLIHIENTKRGDSVFERRMQKQVHDPRITSIGRVLRSWSLDEIPQLFNVLLGEMSLIGPRPIVQSEVAFFGDFFHYYLCALPGMSGLWQVSGRSGIGYSDRAKLDMRYVESWSLALDLKILCRTLPAVLKRVGAV